MTNSLEELAVFSMQNKESVNLKKGQEPKGPVVPMSRPIYALRYSQKEMTERKGQRDYLKK